jgi:hypothetical protein
MDRAIAIKLMEIFENKIGTALSEATKLIGSLPDVDEQKLMRRGVAEMMDTLFVDLQVPIIRQYRDLDPDKDQENQD